MVNSVNGLQEVTDRRLQVYPRITGVATTQTNLRNYNTMRCSICNCKIDNRMVIPSKFNDLCADCTRVVLMTAKDTSVLVETKPIIHRYATEGLQEPVFYTDS